MGKLGIVEIMAILLIPIVIVSILVIASYWKLYEKAGKPGWAAIIPIYSTLILLEIIKKPWWWLLLILFVPVANIIFGIWSINLFVKSFGKSEGFTVGCILLPYVFFPILAFDKSVQYINNDTSELNDIGKYT